MVIAICDDEKNVIEEVSIICKECLGDKNDIIFYQNGKELLDHLQRIELLILDIEMPESNGIAIKEQLQLKNEKPLIIFITNHAQYLMDAFGINVLGFIVKNDLKTQLPIMLNTADQILNRYIMLDDVINSRDILFIRSEHNYGRVTLVNGETQLVRTSMKDLEEKLAGYNFARIHREFLVNMIWIEEYKEDAVIVSGNRIPIATRLRAKVRKEYREFCKRNARYC